MNYKKLYDSLILDAQLNPKADLYKENHHIIPTCLGGSNDTSNIVALTARQHFLAHWLLYKIHKTSKLVHAWNNMCRISGNQENRKQNSHLFEYVKKARSKKLSEEMKGNRFFGASEDDIKLAITKAISTRTEVYKNDPIRYEEAKRKQAIGVSKAMKGVPKSKESNEKRSRKGLIMLKNIHTGEYIRVSKSHSYGPDWVNPYVAREKIFGECPHCQKSGEVNSTFKRWHFDNCKQYRKV